KDIGSIYPEKIVFDGSKVRTTRRNEFVSYIRLINSGLDKNKNGTKIDFSTLSRQVGVAGFEPTTSCSQSRRDTGLRYTPNFNVTGLKSASDIRPSRPEVGTRYRATLHPVPVRVCKGKN